MVFLRYFQPRETPIWEEMTLTRLGIGIMSRVINTFFITKSLTRFLNFKQRIVDWLAETFKRDEGIDLLKDKQALQRLTETAEKAKMELSTLTQTNIR